jgi:hypothetical protein
VDHPLPWLRYVEANRITTPDLRFEGLKVRNDAMETLGHVQGFIVDSTAMRPYYVVVDSGGWFKSKDFLVPIGHARIDADRDALVVDIAKSRIERFPGFDLDEFERLKEEDVRRMSDAICEVCGGEVRPAGGALSSTWERPEYRQPDWWSSVTTRDAADITAGNAYVATPDYPAGKVAPALGELQAERELERNRDRARVDTSARERERELVTAREADPSPHFDGRAQPGDVIGLETGGERTHIGETAEDENNRRIYAEKDYRDDTKK